MEFKKDQFQKSVNKYLERKIFGPTRAASRDETSNRQLFNGISRTLMDEIWKDWLGTRLRQNKYQARQVNYLSAEFLMGRALGNNLVNLGIDKDLFDLLKEWDTDPNELEDAEPDAGLGNGGLGRLAACFLDSLATLELPATGYGIRYKYGMFKQEIKDGYQEEKPDNWLDDGDPWSLCVKEDSVTIRFGGRVEIENREDGSCTFRQIDTEDVTAIPFDTPIIGYKSSVINTLRLWQAESPDGFDLGLFNEEEYQQAVAKANRAEDLSRVLYPTDRGLAGKMLRLKQQYFFVSASLQDIVRHFKHQYGSNFSIFPEKNIIQLNDTHPVVGIPELMRILIDNEKLEWNIAWDICVRTFAYTNHTILAEAMEKWAIDMFSSVLPRIYQIVEEINRRFLKELRVKHPHNRELSARLSIIGDGMIRMAWLAIVGSHSINGVATLHTEILKNDVLKEWYELYPDKFNNKTNGVTQRRWLKKSNSGLSDLISEKLGDGWLKNLDELKKLKEYQNDQEFLERLSRIKRDAKQKLADYIEKEQGIKINPDSIFDIQVKRLHEYKRQLLNILHIISLYFDLKRNPDKNIHPRTFIFAAKAAPGYRRAKQIIKLINDVANKINNDPDIKEKIKVVFIKNYCVSVAELIIPAADVSEQISTAGKEASGTGNMKFMMNGAITIGTMDGANIEIKEEAGDENIVIFGLLTEEVEALNREMSYNPVELLEKNPGLKEVVHSLIDGTFNKHDIFHELYDSLQYGVEGNRADVYYVLKDFNSYREAQQKISILYEDKKRWQKMMLANISGSGKFSSDRTIREYSKDIWKLASLKNS